MQVHMANIILPMVNALSSDGNENSPYWHLGPLKPFGHWHIWSPLSAHCPPLKHVLALQSPVDNTYKDVNHLNVA